MGHRGSGWLIAYSLELADNQSIIDGVESLINAITLATIWTLEGAGRVDPCSRRVLDELRDEPDRSVGKPKRRTSGVLAAGGAVRLRVSLVLGPVNRPLAIDHQRIGRTGRVLRNILACIDPGPVATIGIHLPFGFSNHDGIGRAIEDVT